MKANNTQNVHATASHTAPRGFGPLASRQHMQRFTALILKQRPRNARRASRFDNIQQRVLRSIFAREKRRAHRSCVRNAYNRTTHTMRQAAFEQNVSQSHDMPHRGTVINADECSGDETDDDCAEYLSCSSDNETLSPVPSDRLRSIREAVATMKNLVAIVVDRSETRSSTQCPRNVSPCREIHHSRDNAARDMRFSRRTRERETSRTKNCAIRPQRSRCVAKKAKRRVLVRGSDGAWTSRTELSKDPRTRRAEHERWNLDNRLAQLRNSATVEYGHAARSILRLIKLLRVARNARHIYEDVQRKFPSNDVDVKHCNRELQRKSKKVLHAILNT